MTRFIPELSEDLIDELDKLFPPKCPPIEWSWERTQRYAGMRDLVDLLLQRKQYTKKHRLQKELH